MSEKLTPSQEEENYFKQEELAAAKKKRFHKQLEAIRQNERAGIAKELNTNEAIAQEALELGFDQETARILPLVPIIQMAWADGKVSNAENKQVFKLAQQFGIVEESDAHDFLKMLLNEKPTALFFERANLVIRNLIADSPDTWVTSNIVDLCRSVAEASGGLFGLKNPINDEEAALLDEFAQIFAVADKSTQDVLTSGE